MIVITVYAIIAVLILLIALISSGLFLKYIDRKNRERALNEEKFFASQLFESEEEKQDKVNMSNLTLISDNELDKGDMLGQGAFGTVFEGFYKPNGEEKNKIKVAIKELNAFPQWDKRR